MIKAIEFRKGNYVMDKVSREWMVVDEIGENVGAVLIDRDKYPLPDGWQMTYIPLTPEILEKCGFEKSLSEDVQERTIYGIQVANNTSLYFDPHKDWMRNDYEVEWYLSHEWNNNHFKNDFLAKPKYLHQLQNLYFALTGEELSVNL